MCTRRSPSLAGGRTRMILTVHDELLFEAPKETAEEAAAALREIDGERAVRCACRSRSMWELERTGKKRRARTWSIRWGGGR